jgi:hypothetical protein
VTELKREAEAEEKEAEKVSQMEDKERRKYEREQRKKRQREEDLRPELLLRDEMEMIKGQIAG